MFSTEFQNLDCLMHYACLQKHCCPLTNRTSSSSLCAVSLCNDETYSEVERAKVPTTATLLASGILSGTTALFQEDDDHLSVYGLSSDLGTATMI
jgi:hypothetical protein